LLDSAAIGGYFISFADTAAALESINSWINRVTGGKIPRAVEDVSQNAQIYLGTHSTHCTFI
jgi:hypothetical protein